MSSKKQSAAAAPDFKQPLHRVDKRKRLRAGSSRKTSLALTAAGTKKQQTAEAVAQMQDTTAWIVYTDGASRPKNPGPCGAAAIIVRPDVRSARAGTGSADNKTDVQLPLSKQWSEAKATNNIGELNGILLGLELLEAWQKKEPRQALVLYSDSRYALGVVSQTMQARHNVELVARVRDKLQAVQDQFKLSVDLRWCKAHRGEVWNELADKLAGEAADKQLTQTNFVSVPL